LAIALLMGCAFRGLLYALLLVPWAIPTVVAARMRERIYNADYGVFNYLLGVFFQLAR
jgi:ABC-type sugar transport system permease subunit